jgi:hypothetical protein
VFYISCLFICDQTQNIFVAVEHEILIANLDGAAAVFGQQHAIALLDRRWDERTVLAATTRADLNDRALDVKQKLSMALRRDYIPTCTHLVQFGGRAVRQNDTTNGFGGCHHPLNQDTIKQRDDATGRLQVHHKKWACQGILQH